MELPGGHNGGGFFYPLETIGDPAPEPATVLLMGPVLGWLAWKRRRSGQTVPNS
ncbi:MAG: PEP-CTERM sorting domain-containing protein [Acidimicrobiia bacterium]|nr:PEP-CTERM sorting domain-containing protein [Acidimicrobiia bacterium]